MTYDEIYEQWDTFPDCRVRIPGERVWGKQLPDGNIGLNNMPLDDAYRLHDIVKTKTDHDGVLLLPSEMVKELLVHRRWEHCIRYTWDDPAEEENGKDEEASRALRKKIATALSPLGFPAFFAPGCAYMLAPGDKTEQEAADELNKALSDIGITASLPPRLTREG